MSRKSWAFAHGFLSLFSAVLFVCAMAEGLYAWAAMDAALCVLNGTFSWVNWQLR